MSYKWKPSKAAKREFARKMQNDPDFSAQYMERKAKKADKRRSISKFDYESAGGYYIPTKDQYKFCMSIAGSRDLTYEELDSVNMVISGYSCQEKIDHDYIHVANELIRNSNKL